ncbi:hypothetical protein Pmani_037159 [Petrolisthes manimaculis]|uniref:Uncharacterized protein n=1 Tax=Petrolisthes manimaculis TaxID=1843537 RepID=A0AAE1NHE0_9EUCA|nr:hypothetical protein Pmani_037159 [Petrolisthes manimaculis]
MDEEPVLLYRASPPYLARTARRRRGRRSRCPTFTKFMFMFVFCGNLIVGLLYIIFCGVKIFTGWRIPATRDQTRSHHNTSQREAKHVQRGADGGKQQEGSAKWWAAWLVYIVYCDERMMPCLVVTVFVLV